MDFYFYNANNEKVKLNVSAGANWDELNIGNKQLNSIFSRIDNGDRIVSGDELTLLEKLLHKADAVLGKADKVLENNELDEIVEQINDKKIVLPAKNNSSEKESAFAGGYVVVEHSEPDLAELRKSPEKFYENQENKIKAKLQKEYPSSDYKIEVSREGRGYKYEIYSLSPDKKPPKQFSQTNTAIRADGIELEFKDYYDGAISNDENNDYSKNHQAANFGEFTITDKNGKKHVINYDISDLYGKDVLDCRRVTKKITEFMANLPQETIDKLIENDVREIEFRSEYDDGLVDEKYYRDNNLIDEDGNVIDISGHSVEIISPSFAADERTYGDLSFERNDGTKVNIKDTAETSSEIEIISKSGSKFKLNAEGLDKDQYHQWQLPKLKRVLDELPQNVLKDLSDEIGEIRFLDKWEDASGQYTQGTNTISLKADWDEEARSISFVHELGHAIDEQNGTMFSKSPEFSGKFETLKNTLKKFNIEMNHAMDMPEEFFASAYAYLNIDDKSSANHIAEIEKQIAKFKDSSNPEEKKCYEQFQELIGDVNNYVKKARTMPAKARQNNTLRNLVKTECKEILEEGSKWGHWLNKYFPSQSFELELTSVLSSDDETFESRMKFYETFSKNECKTNYGEHFDQPEEIQQLFAKLIVKMRELRAKSRVNS